MVYGAVAEDHQLLSTMRSLGVQKQFKTLVLEIL